MVGQHHSNHAKVWDVKPDGFQMSIGVTTLLGGWGTIPQKQPIQLAVKIGVVDRSQRTNRVAIDIKITPLGRKPNADVFQSRASSVRDEFRAFCLADHEQLDS